MLAACSNTFIWDTIIWNVTRLAMVVAIVYGLYYAKNH